MSESRPYVVDPSGYVHGPYVSRTWAEEAALPHDRVLMLTDADIHPDWGTLRA